MTYPSDLSGHQIGQSFRSRALVAIAALLCSTSSLTAGAIASLAAQTKPQPLSQRAANSVIQRWPDGVPASADEKRALGILLDGMNAAWYESADGAFYQFIKQSVDRYVASDGSIANPAAGNETVDNAVLGRQSLLLYRVTQQPRYYKAASLIHQQLAILPKAASRNPQSARKHESPLSPEQLYITEPFSAEYASLFQESASYAEITRQFVLTESTVRPIQTGHLQAAHADATPSGDRAAAMGWYMMALVDSLDSYPRQDPGYATLLAILGRSANAILRHHQTATGLWSQDVSTPSGKDNQLSQAASCMLVYALQKGVRMGYLPPRFEHEAQRAWQAISGNSTQGDVASDPTEAGAFILAATEMEMGAQATQANGKTVLIDSWFNSQQRPNAAGQQEYFHYKWNDYSDSGFSLFGHIFASHGAKLAALDKAPTMALLKDADFYIIASPDIPIKNPHPHYAEAKDAVQIAKWVEAGGVLVLMPNDPANGDIEHLDLIADQFGIHFNSTLAHHVVGNDFAPGMIHVSGGSDVFRDSYTLYMKDTCTITPTSAAKTLLADSAGTVMALGKYGKGTVVAVVDPWLYNEYSDHRKLLPKQDNYAAGKEFVTWLLQQSHRSLVR